MNDENPLKRPQPGTWIEIPRQPKQNRCHQCKKRTFFWTLEPEGYLCKTCVNLRNMPQIPSASAANSGKKSRSTIAPATKNAILARRANGQSKLSIAKDVHVAPGTVRKVLNEADFDQLIQQGRSDCAGLLPEAIKGLKRAFERGEGATCCRFLEGMGVLGEKARPKASPVGLNVQQAIQVLIHPGGLHEDAKPLSVTPQGGN